MDKPDIYRSEVPDLEFLDLGELRTTSKLTKIGETIIAEAIDTKATKTSCSQAMAASGDSTAPGPNSTEQQSPADPTESW